MKVSRPAILSFVVAALLSGCATNQVRWQFVASDGSTYSGVCEADKMPYRSLITTNQGALTTWYQNGQKKSEAHFAGGVKDGKRYSNTDWHPNGKIQLQFETKNGLLDGKWITYDGNGEKIYESGYKKGLEHGTARLFHKGKVVETEIWRNGTLIKDP